MLEFCIGVLVGLGIFMAIGLWLTRGEEMPSIPQSSLPEEGPELKVLAQNPKNRTMWDLPDPFVKD